MAGSHLGVTEWREKQPGATSSNLNVPHATQRLYLCPIQQGAQLNSRCASQGCHWWPRLPHWALDPGERACTRVQITWGTFLSSSSVPIFLLPRLSSLTFPLVGTPGTSETLLVYTQTIYIWCPGSHQGHIKMGRGESGCVSASWIWMFKGCWALSSEWCTWELRAAKFAGPGLKVTHSNFWIDLALTGSVASSKSLLSKHSFPSVQCQSNLNGSRFCRVSIFFTNNNVIDINCDYKEVIYCMDWILVTSKNNKVPVYNAQYLEKGSRDVR